MATPQERIDAWYENFIQQVAQPPYSVNLNFRPDVDRIYKMLAQAKENGEEMDNPLAADETLYDKRNELYQLAAAGELYVFHLGKVDESSQIRVEPEDHLLHEMVIELVHEDAPPRPVEQKMNPFKRFLNALFGVFESERLQLKERYEKAMVEYTYQAKGVQAKNSHIKSMGMHRMMAMEPTLETVRTGLPSLMEELNNRLRNENLLSWQREGMEAKLQLFTAMQNGGNFTKEQHLEILAKNIVFRLGEYKDKAMYKNIRDTELQRLLHEEPEKAREYVEMIKQSPGVQSIAERADVFKTASFCTNLQGTDGLINSWLNEMSRGDERMKEIAAEIRQMMETNIDTIESLDRDIPNAKRYPFEKDGYEAKRELLTAQKEGKTLSAEQCLDLLGKVLVGRMGTSANDREASQPNELRDYLRNNPEKAKPMAEAIKNTKIVKDLAEKGDIEEIIRNIRTLKSLDRLVKGALDEVKAIEDQKAAADHSKDMEKVEMKEAPSMGMSGM